MQQQSSQSDIKRGGNRSSQQYNIITGHQFFPTKSPSSNLLHAIIKTKKNKEIAEKFINHNYNNSSATAAEEPYQHGRSSLQKAAVPTSDLAFILPRNTHSRLAKLSTQDRRIS